MFIESRFVWLHLGKTAGTSVRKAFKHAFPDSFLAPDGEPWKHANHEVARRFNVEIPIDRPSAIGFRRLISWAESHLHQQFGKDVPEDVRQRTIHGELVLGPDSQARKTDLFSGVETVDDLLKYYTDHCAPYFIRQEYLRKDFVDFFQRVGVHPQEIRAFKTHIPHVNKGKYKRKTMFSEHEAALLTASCPFWSAIESMIYSNGRG